jgi:hypothetical protein
MSNVACGAAEFTGFEEQTGSLWLPKDSDRIWRGSYKGRDWRYLVRPARGACGARCCSARHARWCRPGQGSAGSGCGPPFLCSCWSHQASKQRPGAMRVVYAQNSYVLDREMQGVRWQGVRCRWRPARRRAAGLGPNCARRCGACLIRAGARRQGGGAWEPKQKAAKKARAAAAAAAAARAPKPRDGGEPGGLSSPSDEEDDEDEEEEEDASETAGGDALVGQAQARASAARIVSRAAVCEEERGPAPECAGAGDRLACRRRPCGRAEWSGQGAG